VADFSGAPDGESMRASSPSWALRDLLLAAAAANHVIARRMGLSLTDLTALDHLLAGQPLGTGELAERLGMRSPSATAVLDRLESAGLVRRTDHPTDRRRVVVEISPEGCAQAEHAVQPLIDQLDGLAAGLTADERQLISDHLEAVARVLRRHGRTEPLA